MGRVFGSLGILIAGCFTLGTMDLAAVAADKPPPGPSLFARPWSKPTRKPAPVEPQKPAETEPGQSPGTQPSEEPAEPEPTKPAQSANIPSPTESASAQPARPAVAQPTEPPTIPPPQSAAASQPTPQVVDNTPTSQRKKLLFWRAFKGPHSVFLFATVPARADFYPLPPLVDRYFKEALWLYVEYEGDSVSQQEYSKYIQQHGIYSGGDDLNKHLTPGTKTALKEILGSWGESTTNCNAYKPFAIVWFLDEGSSRRLNSGPSLHDYFMKKTLETDKGIQALETPESSLGLLASLPEADQDKFLLGTINQIKLARDKKAQFQDAWRTADSTTLQDLLANNFTHRPDLRATYDKVLALQNDSMLQAILHYMKTKPGGFCVLDVSHMLGPSGILARLQADGFTILQVPLN